MWREATVPEKLFLYLHIYCLLQSRSSGNTYGFGLTTFKFYLSYPCCHFIHALIQLTVKLRIIINYICQLFTKTWLMVYFSLLLLGIIGFVLFNTWNICFKLLSFVFILCHKITSLIAVNNINLHNSAWSQVHLSWLSSLFNYWHVFVYIYIYIYIYICYEAKAI